MTRSREEIRNLCFQLGKDKVLFYEKNSVQAYIDHFPQRGSEESGYVKEWLQEHSWNDRVLLIAEKANRIAWLAAVASVVSAFIALIAVLYKD